MVFMVWMVPEIDSGEYPALFCQVHPPLFRALSLLWYTRWLEGVRCPAGTSCRTYSVELLWLNHGKGEIEMGYCRFKGFFVTVLPPFDP